MLVSCKSFSKKKAKARLTLLVLLIIYKNNNERAILKLASSQAFLNFTKPCTGPQGCHSEGAKQLLIFRSSNGAPSEFR